MKRKINLMFLWVLLFIFLTPGEAFATPSITAPNGILMDYHTGEILYEHNAHVVTYPASTTKVMTAILALEKANLEDIVTIDFNLYATGSSMYLRKGESFTVKELIKALLIRSANDAGEALAIHISGSVEEFAKLMNERAKELGALNTHFTNPHGLPDDNHVTTAYDLAMITRHAMKNDLFREIVSTVNLQFEPTEQTPETRYFLNSNRFLWGTGGGRNQMLYRGQYIDIKYDIIDGVKTGYTDKAQQCLITSSIKDGHRLIAVVLGAQGTNIYSDSRTLIDYGYENYRLVQLINKDHLELQHPIEKAKQESVSLYTDSELTTILPINFDLSAVSKEIVLNEEISAPIEAGEILGKVIYTLDNKVLGEVNLIAGESIEPKPLLLRSNILSKFWINFLILFGLWQIFIAYLRFRKRRKRGFRFKNGKISYGFNKGLFHSSYGRNRKR